MFSFRYLLAGALAVSALSTAAAHVIGPRITNTSEIDEQKSYIFVNKATGGVIDIADRTVENLANVYPNNHDGANFQMWRIWQHANGYSYIFNRANDKVMLVAGGNKDPGTNIVQDRNRNSLRNGFHFEAAGNDYFRIVNANSDLPIGVSNPTSGMGVNVEQQADAGADAQLWAIHLAQAPSPEAPDFSLRGFGAYGNVTGGAGGEIVTVSTVAGLKHYISRPQPTIVLVEGTIELPSNPDTPHSTPNNRMYTVSSNKTIIGLPGAHIRFGGFNISRAHNIIIRNLTISEAHDDCINIEHGATRVWIDHNEFYSSGDGLVDVKRESDFITVSWNIFHSHDKTALLGHDNNHTADRGHLRVTYHHNWFRDNEQRNPRVRYARTHVVNNYYENIGGYCIGIGVEAQIISEGNYTASANSGYRLYDSSSQPGFFRDIGSVFSGLNNDLPITFDSGIDWDPSDYYIFEATHVLNVPEMVKTYSGPGVLSIEQLGATIVNPAITQGPVSQIANAGADVTFTATAKGTGPLFYSWTHNDTPIPGADGPQLVLTAATEDDAGTYEVTVANGFGAADTASATLTIDSTPQPPVLIDTPTSVSAFAGGSVTFNVTATGTPPLQYTWRRNGQIISEGPSPSLTLNSLAETDGGQFEVKVSNDVDHATSDPFWLTVETPPPAALLEDTFADGNRSGQNLPDSADWFTSSGSSNFTATTGAATQGVSSSRTILAYFTDSTASSVTLGMDQAIVFEFDFRLTGFDSAQASDTPTLRAGLLRSMDRVNNDFESNNPGSGVFDAYQGYAAFSVVQASGSTTAGFFGRRDGEHNALLGSTNPYTTVGDNAPAPATMSANTNYRARLSVHRADDGHRLHYSIVRISDDAVIMEFAATDADAIFAAFDTVGLHLSKAGGSSNYNFVLTRGAVWVEDVAGPGEPGETFASWIGNSGAPAGQRGRSDNPMGDGIANIFKFVHGMGVMTPYASALIQQYMHTEGNETYPAMVFTRRKDLGDVTLTLQNAPDLAFGTDLGAVIISVTPQADGTEDVMARSAVPLSVQTQQFMRLIAE